MAWRRAPHDLYLQLNLDNLGLTLLVLLLLATWTLPLGITVIFKFQKPLQLIFHPKIVKKHILHNTKKILFSVENETILLVPFPHILSYIFQKMLILSFASSSFPSLLFSLNITAFIFN